MTIGQFLHTSQADFEAAGINTARLDALAILENVLGIPKASLLAHLEDSIDPSLLARLTELAEQRVNRTPLAYLLETKEFFGRDFKVSKDTLIPRPESESMIELAKQAYDPTMSIYDIGAGSGILGITLALETNSLQPITLTDTSQPALDIAKQNAKVYTIEVELVESDLLSNVDIKDGSIVLANLPYVPIEDRVKLYENELATEPASALFADDHGMELYGRLLTELADTRCLVVTECLTSQLTALDKTAFEYGFTLKNRLGLASLYAN